MNNCKDCIYYYHIYDENGLDAQCGGLCHHEDSLVHGVPAMTEPDSTCVNWTALEKDLPFSEPLAPTRDEVLDHLRAELARGERYVALIKRFITVVEKEVDSDAP